MRKGVARNTVLGAVPLSILVFALSLLAHSQATQTIELRVDYNDGVEKKLVLPFNSGMTVFDALNAAQKTPHGLKFDYAGRNGPAQTYFLNQIDDLKNENGGKNSRNWVFWVNNDFADKGFGVCKIAAGDHVLWKFDTFHQAKPGHACR
ncbi:MAG: hypothetical protein NVS1B11_24330 [Terriglobales bacterium]